MTELVKLVGQVKTRMDTGFSRVGKTLDAKDQSQAALMMLASRCASIGNAVMVLVQHQHANEALPLVRSLFELAFRMRAIAAGDVKGEALFLEVRGSDWNAFWDSVRLDGWMARHGVSDQARDAVSRFCADHAQANALGLPWGHVFEQNQVKGQSSEGVLKLAAVALGQALKALEMRWPGAFEGAEQIWEEAKR
jgi:hypothetical protein